ncbi:hypothetical protein BASA81_012705 [Batrachochytrium salamandrivorans]|nr:hypothetical protein BASA81_012705 [Batrachochytrium salamandrivorans]
MSSPRLLMLATEEEGGASNFSFGSLPSTREEGLFPPQLLPDSQEFKETLQPLLSEDESTTATGGGDVEMDDVSTDQDKSVEQPIEEQLTEEEDTNVVVEDINVVVEDIKVEEDQSKDDVASLLLGLANETVTNNADEEEEELVDTQDHQDDEEQEQTRPTPRKNPPRRGSSSSVYKKPHASTSAHTPTKTYNEKLYSYCWGVMKDSMGWTCKSSNKLSSNWRYLAPDAPTKTKDQVENVHVFHSEQALMDHIEANMPDLFREARKERKDWQKTWTNQSPASAESIARLKKLKHTPPSFTQIWQTLKSRGWTWDTGRYMVPKPPPSEADRVQDEHYFLTKQAMLDHLAKMGEVFLPDESEESSAMEGAESEEALEEESLSEEDDEQDFVPPKEGSKYWLKQLLPVFETDLWVHLERKMQWTYTRGKGVIEYVFYPPQSKPACDGGRRNVDYFESRDRVYEFVSNHPEHLAGLKFRGRDMSTLQYTNDLNDPLGVQYLPPVRRSPAAPSAPKRKKTAPQRKPTTVTVSSSRKPQATLKELLPGFEKDLWTHLSKNMGWTYVRGSGLVEYVYLRPGGKLERDGGRRNVDYFESQDAVYDYVTVHYKFLEGLEYLKKPLAQAVAPAAAAAAATKTPKRPKPSVKKPRRLHLRTCLPVFETDLWIHLEREMQWTYARGSGLTEYVYFPPNAKSQKEGGKHNVDYFESESKVYDFVSKNPKFLKGLLWSGKDMSKMEFVMDSVSSSGGSDGKRTSRQSTSLHSSSKPPRSRLSSVRKPTAPSRVVKKPRMTRPEEEEEDQESQSSEVDETSRTSIISGGSERRRNRHFAEQEAGGGESRIHQFTASLGAAPPPKPSAAVVVPPKPAAVAPKLKAAAVTTTLATSTGQALRGYVFSLTGMEQEVALAMQRAIVAQQGRVVNDLWSAKLSPTLVLLCQPGSFRTSTYLCAIARQIPILHPNWLWQSLAAQAPCEYNQYELPVSFFLHPTKSILPTDSNTWEYTPSSQWRVVPESTSIFQGKVFQVMDNAKPMQRLVEAMGGQVCEQDQDDAILLTPVESYSNDIALRMMRKRPVFTFEWVTQCLLHGKYLGDGVDKPHVWFQPVPQPSPAIAQLLESDVDKGLVTPLVVSLASPTACVSVEVFQLRNKRYYVGDFVLVGGDDGDGEEEEDEATFGRIRKVEFDVDSLKYRMTVDVLHRAGAAAGSLFACPKQLGGKWTMKRIRDAGKEGAGRSVFMC